MKLRKFKEHFEHRCPIPRGRRLLTWTCPSCRRVWSKEPGAGSVMSSPNEGHGEIVSVLMRYADGSTEVFDA